MRIRKTKRGFGRIEFKDYEGIECSLQQSSLATTNAIWLGMNKPEIKEFYPIPRETEESWFDVEDLSPLKHRPQNEIITYSRMHLTQKQVKRLLPHLIAFAETGSIEVES